MFKCSNCGAPYTLDDAKCVKCGHVLFDPGHSTIALQIDPTVLRMRQPQPTSSDCQPPKSVALVVRGMVERFTVKEGTEIVLGRTDLRMSDSSHFDLTRYGGQDKGVSRNHAILRFSGEAITVTDMGSANGTFINTQRLEPNKPQALHTEDKLMLGSLSMVVRFE